MRKLVLFLVFLLIVGLQVVLAQKTITGKVTSSEDGLGMPGATVLIKGTTTGVITDMDGGFKIAVPPDATKLVISVVGMKAVEVEIGTQTAFAVVMEPEAKDIEGVVITALGISREKKSLGYATQEVKGEALSTVKSANFINSMSGKVTGVQIKKTTNMGGSTNVLIRGNKSLTGNNQVLFVVDGVPMNNQITNSRDQEQAGLGYDYGNAASDINPEDIASVNVLKGAAASALYGSRASNGVVMITTKKGIAGAKKNIGITVNSGITFGSVDKSTFPDYQKDYGGGYGHYYTNPLGYNAADDPLANKAAYWYIRDANGDGVNEQWAVTSEDASYGAPFDPNLNVYQWDAVDVESPNYRKATPWINAANGPITFFEKPITYTNTVAISNTLEDGSYRFSYTNYKQNGLLPNSELKKNNLSLNSSWKVNPKITVDGSANYIQQKAQGRNSTGYSDNQMGNFRQWWQTNVDLKALKDAYFTTKRNITWNWSDPTIEVPIFWDNPYWQRYENYQSDSRNRISGYASLNYKLADWVEVFGRLSVDSYNELQEERRAVGSIPSPFGIGVGADGSTNRSDQGSGYLRRDITFSEYNYDVMMRFKKDITTDFNFNGVLGVNVRKTNFNRVISATNGGIGVPGLYSLQNSVNPLPYPKELASKVGVRGVYGSASFGFKNMLYLDVTGRNDWSSTLPIDNRSFFYPSVALSFVFSEAVKTDWLSFGKLRLNYAGVSNGAAYDQLANRYNVVTPLNSPMTSVDGTFKNSELKPENTTSIEAGLEMFFFERRLGFDLAFYKTNTTDQILPLTLSTSTGYNFKIINAGELENKGVEFSLMGTPVRKTSFKWDIAANWSKNTNKVLSLVEGVDNLQLGSFQGGVTLNARVGEPYGVLFGTDYTYDDAGQRIIVGSGGLAGQYEPTDNVDNVIGDVNPDWNMGITNTFSYKNWSFSFLIDIQQGGSIFSLDMYYGLATGLYKETSFINDLGNPVRNTLLRNPDGTYDPASGGFINQGVNVERDGNGVITSSTPNVTRIRADRYGAFGYARGLPNSAFVYDASYVKLREISISYSLPAALLSKSLIKGITLSAVGSNLWIISKNLPHADPESGLGAGNLQGYSTGSLPSTRDIGFDLKLNF